jgi:hypothetical protein
LLVRDPESEHFSISKVERVEAISATLLNWNFRDKDRLAEFQAIGARLGVWTRVLTETFAMGDQTHIGLATLDGVNVGQVSDGTLRIAEILRLLLIPSKLLLIEEPETSIHPGLLRRLLAEIAAYSGDRQTILSTHSAQVVTMAAPCEIRLVQRVDGVTSTAPLTDEQVSRLGDYLSDEGTLGDFVFGGGVEDEAP